MASFLGLIVDAATKDYTPLKKSAEIRCLTKNCKGIIEISVDTKNEFIHWNCSTCSEAGRISDWQKTKFDNRSGNQKR